MARSVQALSAAFAAAVLAAWTPTLRAGFTSLYTDLPADSYAVTPDITSTGEITGASVSSSLVDGTDYFIGGTANGDPTLYIVETIKNNTSDTWTGYTIVITPDVPLVVSSVTVMSALVPAYQKFGPSGPVESDFPVGSGWEIDYSGGTVAPGEFTQFVIQFDISDVPTFGYHVFNTPGSGTPTPEPASLMVLSVGGLALLRRRRTA